MTDIQSVKKLRQSTGAGFKDCNAALNEAEGDLEKAAEILRIKGIAKASKKMSRIAADGLILVNEKDGNVSALEINSETDFVAKNKDFISFCKEVAILNFKNKADLTKLNNSKMNDNKTVEENLVTLISKIGEKITIRRSKYFDNEGKNFFYVHNSSEKNIGKVVSIVKLSNTNSKDLDFVGSKLAMHIAAQSPLAINDKGIKKDIINKELEIIKEELKNSGKKPDMIEKIATGKIKKFISENTLLNQTWIMDTKITVGEFLKQYSNNGEINIIDFVRYKVGEGI